MNRPAKIPRATYRLQFHRDFKLKHAWELVPYLNALGVSHVYASPLLKARAGSTHGYDVCDPTQINPEIGTEADLEMLVAKLRRHEMGLVLDIVPNHVAAVTENPWWWDVLKYGRASRFAEFFDIDWESPDPQLRGKVLLPVLGDELERVLERGELTIEDENGELILRYFDHRFPINPKNAESKSPFRTLLEQQHYRLEYWRKGDTQLNYRRFFTITDLAGVRVELPEVFRETHQRILEWHRRGLLDGLRVDHPDGLRDPESYLQCLKQATPDAWIVIEKILEPGEALPGDWPVAGTTGYDFLNRVAGLFIDPAGEKPLTDFYAQFTGEPVDYAAMVREKKRWILRHQLVAEVERLLRLLVQIASQRASEPAADPGQLREALIELIVCFPVYRAYARAGTKNLSATDEVWISQALKLAIDDHPQPWPIVLAFLSDLLLLKLPGKLEDEFVMRFQQLTGPAMAKGVEDTTFYCFNRFIALNEVGGDPGHFGNTVEEFQRACVESQTQWPNSMLATATHDTKRSEEMRARLAVLSEIPEQWIEAVQRWSKLNEKHRCNGNPDRNAEYHFYQTIVGAWPLSLNRALAYLEKAAREAKQHTNWNEQNQAYETDLREFVAAVLNDAEFVNDLDQFVKTLLLPGQINSLAQTLLKLTATGVPDIYQGTEFWDFSLVDPDNRRPVDYAVRQEALKNINRRLEAGDRPQLIDELLQHSGDGRVKLFVIEQTLQLRRRHDSLFRTGRYVALPVFGKHAQHVCAFARLGKAVTAITVVPRLLMQQDFFRHGPAMGKEIWEDTRLVLPPALNGVSFRHLFTDEPIQTSSHDGAATLSVADVFDQFPVALLHG